MSFISRIHKDIRSTLLTRRGASMRPSDVPIGIHKEYPRFPRVLLPAPAPLSMPLDAALAKRSSGYDFTADGAFSDQELGTLLGNALGARKDAQTRNYPSGGALFPIETYIIGHVFQDHPEGVFHYHPKTHALEHLWQIEPGFTTARIIAASATPAARALIVFTAVWERSSAKYGDLAYQHGLIEAGHMAENILLVGTSLEMSIRPVAGCNDEMIADILGIDNDTEQPVYALLISPGEKLGIKIGPQMIAE